MAEQRVPCVIAESRPLASYCSRIGSRPGSCSWVSLLFSSTIATVVRPAGVLFVAAAAAEGLAREPSGLSADWGQPPPLNAGMMVGMIWRLLRR